MNTSIGPTRFVGFKIEGVGQSEVENLKENMPESERNSNRFKYEKGLGPDTSYTRALALISQEDKPSKPTSRCAIVKDRQEEEETVARAGRLISRIPSVTRPVTVSNFSSHLNLYDPMLEARYRRLKNEEEQEGEPMIFSFKEPVVPKTPQNKIQNF